MGAPVPEMDLRVGRLREAVELRRDLRGGEPETSKSGVLERSIMSGVRDRDPAMGGSGVPLRGEGW